MRIFALSDIHVDYAANLRWVDALSSQEYREDVLILAGDVTHRLQLLAQTFEILLRKFASVFFVPGNHDLWLHAEECSDSLAKYGRVMSLCQSLGIQTQPQSFMCGSQSVAIVPLLSWYTKPEEGPDSLFVASSQDDAHLSWWADNYRIRWPDLAGQTPTQFFIRQNEERVARSYRGERISFSHFLPRRELMFRSADAPATERSYAFNFSRVAGSTLLEEQIRRLGSAIHVYGHQHRNRCRFYDNVWYISSCLGYLEERREQIIDVRAMPITIWPRQEAWFLR